MSGRRRPCGDCSGRTTSISSQIVPVEQPHRLRHRDEGGSSRSSCRNWPFAPSTPMTRNGRPPIRTRSPRALSSPNTSASASSQDDERRAVPRIPRRQEGAGRTPQLPDARHLRGHAVESARSGALASARPGVADATGIVASTCEMRRSASASSMVSFADWAGHGGGVAAGGVRLSGYADQVGARTGELVRTTAVSLRYRREQDDRGDADGDAASSEPSAGVGPRRLPTTAS